MTQVARFVGASMLWWGKAYADPPDLHLEGMVLTPPPPRATANGYRVAIVIWKLHIGRLYDSKKLYDIGVSR